MENGFSYADHSERLLRLETTLSDLHVAILPALARIEANLGTVGEEVTDLKTGLERVEVASQVAAQNDVLRDQKLVALERVNADRKNWAKGFMKVVGGVVSTVVAAYLLIKMGIR